MICDVKFESFDRLSSVTCSFVCFPKCACDKQDVGFWHMRPWASIMGFISTCVHDQASACCPLASMSFLAFVSPEFYFPEEAFLSSSSSSSSRLHESLVLETHDMSLMLMRMLAVQ